MHEQAVWYHRRMPSRGLRPPGAALLLFVLAASLAATKTPPDPLLTARRLYNQGQYEQALEAAQQAAANPDRKSVV